MPGFLIEKRRSMRSVSGFFEARKVSPSVPLEEERNSSSSCSSPLEPIYSSKCIPFYYGGKHKGACRSSSQTQGSRFLNVFAKDGDGIPSSGSCKNVSDEGEHDLAALVHDFIENGSGTSDPAKDGTQTENSAAVMVKLNDSLQALSGPQFCVVSDGISTKWCRVV